MRSSQRLLFITRLLRPRRFGLGSLSLGPFICSAVFFSPGSVFMNPAFAGPENAATPVKFFSGSSRRETLVERPEQQSFRLNEEGVELIFQGKPQAGQKKIEQALQYDSENATALYNLAGLELANSHPKEAIKLMERALLLHPDDLAFLNRLAESHFADSDVASAIENYERIVSRDPTFGEAMARLGTLYGMQRDWDKAETTLRKAVEVHPKDVQALSNLGNTLVLREKFQDGVTFLTRAQQLHPTPENAVALGIAYEAMGDRDAALSQYRSAKKLGDKDEQLTSHIDELVAGKSLNSTALTPNSSSPASTAAGAAVEKSSEKTAPDQ